MAGRKRSRKDPEVVNSQHHTPHEELTEDTEQPVTDEETSKHPSGLNKVTRSASHRSAQDVVKGGQNEVEGEPEEGYHTVAPGTQGGGRQ